MSKPRGRYISRQKPYPIYVIVPTIIVLLGLMVLASWLGTSKEITGVAPLCDLIVGGIALVATWKGTKPKTLMRQLLTIAGLFFVLGAIAQIIVLFN